MPYLPVLLHPFTIEVERAVDNNCDQRHSETGLQTQCKVHRTSCRKDFCANTRCTRQSLDHYHSQCHHDRLVDPHEHVWQRQRDQRAEQPLEYPTL